MAVVQQAKFAIGQVVHFQLDDLAANDKSRKQLKKEKRKVNQIGVPPNWEIMFRSQWTAEHRSIPISELERYA